MLFHTTTMSLVSANTCTHTRTSRRSGTTVSCIHTFLRHIRSLRVWSSLSRRHRQYLMTIHASPSPISSCHNCVLHLIPSFATLIYLPYLYSARGSRIQPDMLRERAPSPLGSLLNTSPTQLRLWHFLPPYHNATVRLFASTAQPPFVTHFADAANVHLPYLLPLHSPSLCTFISPPLLPTPFRPSVFPHPSPFSYSSPQHGYLCKRSLAFTYHVFVACSKCLPMCTAPSHEIISL